jgi:ABC-2 type transport system permease protein
MTATPRPAAPRLAACPAAARPVVWDLVRSEWVKLRTLRSTWWTLGSAVAGMTGFGALLAAAYAAHSADPEAAARARFDPAAYSLSGFFAAQLAVGVLGALVWTGEYATGSVRGTFAAAPQRGLVLAAKAAVFGGVAVVTGLVSSCAAFFLGQAILARKGLEGHLADPGALRSVAGAGLYLAVIGLLALGLGGLVRRTAGAVALLVGVVFVVPVLVQGLPSGWQDAVARYLPSAAGQAVIGRTKFAPPGGMLPPWGGLGLLAGYAAAVLIVAAVALARRDA